MSRYGNQRCPQSSPLGLCKQEQFATSLPSGSLWIAGNVSSCDENKNCGNNDGTVKDKAFKGHEERSEGKICFKYSSRSVDLCKDNCTVANDGIFSDENHGKANAFELNNINIGTRAKLNSVSFASDTKDRNNNSSSTSDFENNNDEYPTNNESSDNKVNSNEEKQSCIQNTEAGDERAIQDCVRDHDTETEAGQTGGACRLYGNGDTNEKQTDTEFLQRQSVNNPSAALHYEQSANIKNSVQYSPRRRFENNFQALNNDLVMKPTGCNWQSNHYASDLNSSLHGLEMYEPVANLESKDTASTQQSLKSSDAHTCNVREKIDNIKSLQLFNLSNFESGDPHNGFNSDCWERQSGKGNHPLFTQGGKKTVESAYTGSQLSFLNKTTKDYDDKITDVLAELDKYLERRSTESMVYVSNQLHGDCHEKDSPNRSQLYKIYSTLRHQQDPIEFTEIQTGDRDMKSLEFLDVLSVSLEIADLSCSSQSNMKGIVDRQQDACTGLPGAPESVTDGSVEKKSEISESSTINSTTKTIDTVSGTLSVCRSSNTSYSSSVQEKPSNSKHINRTSDTEQKSDQTARRRMSLITNKTLDGQEKVRILVRNVNPLAMCEDQNKVYETYCLVSAPYEKSVERNPVLFSRIDLPTSSLLSSFADEFKFCCSKGANQYAYMPKAYAHTFDSAISPRKRRSIRTIRQWFPLPLGPTVRFRNNQTSVFLAGSQPGDYDNAFFDIDIFTKVEYALPLTADELRIDNMPIVTDNMSIAGIDNCKIGDENHSFGSEKDIVNVPRDTGHAESKPHEAVLLCKENDTFAGDTNQDSNKATSQETRPNDVTSKERKKRISRVHQQLLMDFDEIKPCTETYSRSRYISQNYSHWSAWMNHDADLPPTQRSADERPSNQGKNEGQQEIGTLTIEYLKPPVNGLIFLRQPTERAENLTSQTDPSFHAPTTCPLQC